MYLKTVLKDRDVIISVIPPSLKKHHHPNWISYFKASIQSTILSHTTGVWQAPSCGNQNDILNFKHSSGALRSLGGLNLKPIVLWHFALSSKYLKLLHSHLCSLIQGCSWFKMQTGQETDLETFPSPKKPSFNFPSNFWKGRSLNI